MLTILLTLVYVAVCIFLIMVVLLQTGRRADLAGAFGGGSSQTAFGARGAATMLAKWTTISAILFMVLALALSILSSHRGQPGSVLDEVEPSSNSTPASAPQAPAQGEFPLQPQGETSPPAGEPVEQPTSENPSQP